MKYDMTELTDLLEAMDGLDYETVAAAIIAAGLAPTPQEPPPCPNAVTSARCVRCGATRDRAGMLKGPAGYACKTECLPSREATEPTPKPYCAACRGHGTNVHDDECEDYVTVVTTVQREAEPTLSDNPIVDVLYATDGTVLLALYARTVGAFNALTGRDLTIGEGILYMQLVKLSRQRHSPKRDNLVDLCGYALCEQMVADADRWGETP